MCACGCVFPCVYACVRVCVCMCVALTLSSSHLLLKHWILLSGKGPTHLVWLGSWMAYIFCRKFASRSHQGPLLIRPHPRPSKLTMTSLSWVLISSTSTTSFLLVLAAGARGEGFANCWLKASSCLLCFGSAATSSANAALTICNGVQTGGCWTAGGKAENDSWSHLVASRTITACTCTRQGSRLCAPSLAAASRRSRATNFWCTVKCSSGASSKACPLRSGLYSAPLDS